jgi:hypothetical protein
MFLRAEKYFSRRLNSIAGKKRRPNANLPTDILLAKITLGA